MRNTQILEEDAVSWHPLKLNPAEYLETLEGLDLSEEQKIAVVETLWQIMNYFMDLAWGNDSVQHFSRAGGDMETS